MAFQPVLHHDFRKMFANSRTGFDSTAIRAEQLDHFKIFFENESTRLEKMAEVSKGMTSMKGGRKKLKYLRDGSCVVQRSSPVTMFDSKDQTGEKWRPVCRIHQINESFIEDCRKGLYLRP